MPWKTIKRDCKQSSGKKGSHVVVKVKKGGGTEQESCHTSEEEAKSAIRARYANESNTVKITRKQLRKIISERLNSNTIRANIIEMGRRSSGVDLNTLNSMYGPASFDIIDDLSEEGLGILDEEEGVFYTQGSSGIEIMLKRRGLR